MTDLEPKVNFGSLDNQGITTIGLDAAQCAFNEDVAMGLTNGDSICLVVGVVQDSNFEVWGMRSIGPDAENYLGNIDPETGMLATTLQYMCDSVVAYHDFGPTEVPAGPQRYTGGVYHDAYVKTLQRGWQNKAFVGAGAGVQGPIDQATVYSALTRMSAAWALQQQALYGKGE